ncbi:unnamed protein product [Agarophyton chilense]
MLLTDLELRRAKENLTHFEQTFTQNQQEKLIPARYRLNLKLPHVSSFLNSDDILVATLDMLQNTWKRLAKIQILIEDPKLQPFDHEFEVHQNAIIRIFFWKQREPTYPIGNLVLSLTDLRMGADEKLLLLVEGLPRSKNIAEISVGWITPKIEKVLLNVQVRVNKKKGWPFSKARVYYILYTWEPNGNTMWKPIYRSEILTNLSNDPCSKAPMNYTGAVIRMDGNKVDENQTRSFRIEFLHYKATRQSHKILGSSVFSLQQLRQTVVPYGRLYLKVSNIPESELVGALQLLKTTLEYGKSSFRLEASFGGEISEDILYIDVEVLNKTRASVRRISFEISVYTDQGAWEKFYGSEMSPNLAAGECHSFSVAKLSEKKLQAGATRRWISIAFSRREGGRQLQVGVANTTLSDLSSGQVLPLENEEGLLRVRTMDRVTNGSSKAHLALCYEYGAEAPARENHVNDPMRMQQNPRNENRMPTERLFYSDYSRTDDSPCSSTSS